MYTVTNSRAGPVKASPFTVVGFKQLIQKHKISHIGVASQQSSLNKRTKDLLAGVENMFKHLEAW